MQQLANLPFMNLKLAGLSTELTLLLLAVALGLFQLLIAARANNSQRGIKWNVGPRDEPGAETSKLAGRLERAYRNFMETFPFFGAVVLIAALANRHNAWTLLGANLYFWGRVIYLPLYALGIPVLRTLVWLAATVGIIMMLVAILMTG
jgi:uncharacterized MAPEG superfamily protein